MKGNKYCCNFNREKKTAACVYYYCVLVALIYTRYAGYSDVFGPKIPVVLMCFDAKSLKYININPGGTREGGGRNAIRG